MILINIDDSEFQRRIRGLLEALDDSHLPTVLGDIGERFIDMSKKGITSGQDWQGRPFAPNTEVTLARKRGSKPLIDNTTFVTSQLFHRVAGHTVELHANAAQAGVLYFGAAKGQFGKTKRGSPIPWGRIAPRPYFPFTDDRTALVPAAHAEAVTLVREYLEGAQR